MFVIKKRVVFVIGIATFTKTFYSHTERKGMKKISQLKRRIKQKKVKIFAGNIVGEIFRRWK